MFTKVLSGPSDRPGCPKSDFWVNSLYLYSLTAQLSCCYVKRQVGQFGLCFQNPKPKFRILHTTLHITNPTSRDYYLDFADQILK